MNGTELNTVNGILLAVEESEYAELTKVTVFSRGEEEVFDLIGRTGYAKQALLEAVGIGEPIEIIWGPYRGFKAIRSWDCGSDVEIGVYPGTQMTGGQPEADIEILPLFLQTCITKQALLTS